MLKFVVTVAVLANMATLGYAAFNCSINGCLNTGICQVDGRCECLGNDYGGYDCSLDARAGINIGKCLSQNPCSNGATCYDVMGSARCYCPYGKYGKLCDRNSQYLECKRDWMVINIYPGYGFKGQVGIADHVKGGLCTIEDVASQVEFTLDPTRKAWEGYAASLPFTNPTCGNGPTVTSTAKDTTYTYEVVVQYVMTQSEESFSFSCTVPHNGGPSIGVIWDPLTGAPIGAQSGPGTYGGTSGSGAGGHGGPSGSGGPTDHTAQHGGTGGSGYGGPPADHGAPGAQTYGPPRGGPSGPVGPVAVLYSVSDEKGAVVNNPTLGSIIKVSFKVDQTSIFGDVSVQTCTVYNGDRTNSRVVVRRSCAMPPFGKSLVKVGDEHVLTMVTHVFGPDPRLQFECSIKVCKPGDTSCQQKPHCPKHNATTASSSANGGPGAGSAGPPPAYNNLLNLLGLNKGGPAGSGKSALNDLLASAGPPPGGQHNTAAGGGAGVVAVTAGDGQAPGHIAAPPVNDIVNDLLAGSSLLSASGGPHAGSHAPMVDIFGAPGAPGNLDLNALMGGAPIPFDSTGWGTNQAGPTSGGAYGRKRRDTANDNSKRSSSGEDNIVIVRGSIL